jgi:hypothetical protein
LLRHLLDPNRAPNWANLCRRSLTNAILGMLAVPTESDSSKISAHFDNNVRGLAALGVLGGLPDSLRQGEEYEFIGRCVIFSPLFFKGGRVEVVAHDDTSPTRRPATVVDYLYGSEYALIILDSDQSKTLQRVEVSSLVPIPDVALDSSLFVITPEILQSLLTVAMTTPSPSQTTKNISSSDWLKAKLRSASLKCLDLLMTNATSAEVFFRDDWGTKLQSLEKMAEPCGTGIFIHTHTCLLLTQLHFQAVNCHY